MTKPIRLNHTLADFFDTRAVVDATRLVNHEVDGPQLFTIRRGLEDQLENHIMQVLDVLASEIRSLQGSESAPKRGFHITTTLLQDPDAEAFRRGVEPSADFERGVDEAMKSSRICGVMAGLVGFACGAFLAVLLLTIGGVA